MRLTSLPATGPLHLDCRSLSTGAALRRIEGALRRCRCGPRLVRVTSDEEEVIDAIASWARYGPARYEVFEQKDRFVIDIYLLPSNFDEHPFLAWRPRLAEVDPAITPSL